MLNHKLAGMFFAVAAIFFINTAQAEIVVVVNKANQATLSKNDVARIFLGKMKSYSSGGSVTPVNIDRKHKLRGEFNKKALNKSSSQVKAYWSKLVFSGKGTPPKEFASDAKVKAFIAANPDAIGYIDRTSLDDSVKSVLSL